MGVTDKTEIKATVVFEAPQYADIAVTWQLGTRILQLVSKGHDRPANVMRPVHIAEATIECAQREAEAWLAAMDIFEAPDVESVDDDEHWSE